MKIRIDKTDLLRGIQVVGNVITTRSVLPILSNILLETAKNRIKLTTTDLDIGISLLLNAEVVDPGAITISTKRLSDIIKELPAGVVALSTRKNNVVDIQLESCEFRLMGLPKEEFPRLPDFKEKNEVTFEQAALKQMLQLTAFAISHEETRYVLNGLLFELKNETGKGVVKFVGTDGRRLAVVEKKLDIKSSKEFKIIIPHKAIQELLRNLGDEGEVTVGVGPNQIFFEMDGITLISRLIEGEFPDYRRVIPPASSTKVPLEKEAFVLALRRANLLTTPDFQAVKFEVFKNKLVISKTTPDIGEFKEEIAIDYGGKEMLIGFNPTYFLDMLRHWPEEGFALELYDADKPGVVRSDEYVYIVQPMRLG